MADIKNIQYDSANISVGGINVVEAIETYKNIYFNESYIVLGKKLKSKKIHATYDLTIMGNVEADSIEVNGELLVKGNIKANTINCLRLTCTGKVNVNSIVCDENIMVKNINTENIQGQSSIIVSDTISISKNCEVDENIIAGEGITGCGELKAKVAIAGEYLDFDGEINAHIYEISTMFENNDIKVTDENLENATWSEMLEKYIHKFVDNVKDMEEEYILEELLKCSKKQKISFDEMYYLFCEIDRISYLNEIDNLKDFLIIKYAEEMFPVEFKEYETISHVFDLLIKDVSEDNLEYTANNLIEFMFSLKIITTIFGEEKSLYADKIFSFIGLKYSFVNKQFER